jgi:CysZ protein
MSAVPAALLKALGQLGDRAVMAVLVKSVAVTLAVFALAGWGLYEGLAVVLREERIAALLPEGFAPAAQALAALVIGLAAFWFLFRVVALAVLQFFADEVVAAVEARHYPALAGQARPLPLAREVAVAVRGLLRVVSYNLLALPVAAVLAVTAIGPAVVFLAVNALLLGRECTDMAWLRHCAGDERGNPVGAGERFLLGAAVAGLMLVPLANLLAPVVGAAAGTHLVLRRLEGSARR